MKTALAITALLLAACGQTDVACNQHDQCMSGFATDVRGKVVTGRLFWNRGDPKHWVAGGGETSDHVPVEVLKHALPAAGFYLGAKEAARSINDIDVKSKVTVGGPK